DTAPPEIYTLSLPTLFRSPVNLRGKLVGVDGDQFVFVESATGAPANQSMLDWIDSVSTKLRRGFVIAIDYGFSRAEFREVLQVRSEEHTSELQSPCNLVCR